MATTEQLEELVRALVDAGVAPKVIAETVSELTAKRKTASQHAVVIGDSIPIKGIRRFDS